ncbi:hypothetical protein [Butyrivibrio sp. XPD2002]|uniref:hypothetical protein n=1 Tax=Butyrivibrio sp. XPD2002 TaxID=1280665 RepID=UPI00047A0F11|nr:hypothetical protein [Butyrivibrio sp. XPD2002]
MDIREYKVKELPYKYVLFYNIPVEQMESFRIMLSGDKDDNAILTYCYIDPEAGVSYKGLCSCKITGDKVRYNLSEQLIGLTLREGGIECDAIVMENVAEGYGFQEEAESIKEEYGYFEEKVAIDYNNIFDAYRHPFYPDDIQVFFPTSAGGYETMWVEENGATAKGIMCRLLNEPYDESIGYNYGDLVNVVPKINSSGEIIPVADGSQFCKVEPEDWNYLL